MRGLVHDFISLTCFSFPIVVIVVFLQACSVISLPKSSITDARQVFADSYTLQIVKKNETTRVGRKRYFINRLICYVIGMFGFLQLVVLKTEIKPTNLIFLSQ